MGFFSSLFGSKKTEISVNTVAQKIYFQEYIDDLRIGHSWILPQMVRMGFDKNTQRFSEQKYRSSIYALGFAKCWDIVKDNLRTMAIISTKDPEEYAVRAIWWNRQVATDMAMLNFTLLKRYMATLTPLTNCSGGPYVFVPRLHKRHNRQDKMFFLSTPAPGTKWNASNSKLLVSLYQEFELGIQAIASATTADQLYKAFCAFDKHRCTFSKYDTQDDLPASFYNAFYGQGAYYAMLSMVKFLGICHRNDYDMTMDRDQCIADIKQKAYNFGYNGQQLLAYCDRKFFNRAAGGVFDYQAYMQRKRRQTTT